MSNTDVTPAADPNRRWEIAWLAIPARVDRPLIPKRKVVTEKQLEKALARIAEAGGINVMVREEA